MRWISSLTNLVTLLVVLFVLGTLGAGWVLFIQAIYMVASKLRKTPLAAEAAEVEG